MTSSFSFTDAINLGASVPELSNPLMSSSWFTPDFTPSYTSQPFGSFLSSQPTTTTADKSFLSGDNFTKLATGLGGPLLTGLLGMGAAQLGSANQLAAGQLMAQTGVLSGMNALEMSEVFENKEKKEDQRNRFQDALFQASLQGGPLREQRKYGTMDNLFAAGRPDLAGRFGLYG